MTSRQALQSTDAIRGLCAVAILVLGSWISPAFASAGVDTRCDQSIEPPQTLDVRAEELTIEVVDHGTTNSLATGKVPVDDLMEGEDAVSPPADVVRSRVEAILRRIFDEPQLRRAPLSEPDEFDTRTAPLAVDGTDNAEEPASTGDDNGTATGVASGLPGVSGDDLVRFRQQMYRTDI